jgi:FHS family L-fucose permease-like MFS transporter
MAVITAFVQLPDVIEKGDSKSDADGSAWSFSHLRLGALAIFFYVGAEVAIGSIMITYLGQPSMGGLSHEAAARYVSYYWGLSLIGRFAGYFAMRWIRAQRALAVVSMIAAVLITLTVAAHGHIAMWAVVFCGLCNSVMWPCIFPLAVKGLGRFTSQGSGILITMVVGGAVIPEIQGFLADTLGYQHSFAIVLVCYAYIFFFAIRGHRNLISANAGSKSAALIQ